MKNKTPNLEWIEELLPRDTIKKSMFGGYAYYLNNQLVLVLFESKTDKQYKNQKFDFLIWNGCLFPVEKKNQQKARHLFPILFPHPVLGKWLYLPLETENFEEIASKIVKKAILKPEIFGTIPKEKKKSLKVKKQNQSEEIDLIDYRKMDTRRPKMFSDQEGSDKILEAKKISDFKNLGPASELHFKKAGIKSAKQFIKMGWQKTLEKLAKSNPRHRHSIYAYALIGALQNREWHRISPADKMAAKEFVKSLKKSQK